MVSSILLITLLVSSTCVIHGQNITFDPSGIEKLVVGEQLNVTASLNSVLCQQLIDGNVAAKAEPYWILEAKVIDTSVVFIDEDLCNVTIELDGLFLGFGTVHLAQKKKEEWTTISPTLKVTVIREDKLINKVFVAFVATIVTINYINMGCALELDVMKKVLKKPIAPAVGFVCQFILMPLVSYGFGILLFDDPVLRLGLFTFGCSPGGGASNMWTVLLGGNLNLSIAMTFISTIAALGTIPIWLFTLGRTIIEGTDIHIPYKNLLISLASLTIPICIGLLIQKYFPRFAAASKRILAPVCIAMIICIIVLASVANYYMFLLMTWTMVVAATLSVWTGFCAGAFASLVFRFPLADVIAVAVETGIQNSGIAFVLLSYSLKPPVSEMAAVVPVVGSIMTPIPLFVIYLSQKIRNCCCRKDAVELQPINGAKEMKNFNSANLEEDSSS